MNQLDIQELILEIETDFQNFKEKINISKKLKGKNRLEYVNNIRDKDYKRIRTYINHLESSVSYNQQSQGQQSINQKRAKVQKYKQKLDKYIKKLQSSKNEVLTEEVLFQDRAFVKGEFGRDQLIEQADQAQKKSQQAVTRALQNMYEMQGIGRNVNQQLQRQINQLDSIYETLQDTQSSMNRALRHINYFARSVYTDKILMGLIALIIIAIITIIVLSAIGKIPGSQPDTLS